jgi:hypothetical protein
MPSEMNSGEPFNNAHKVDFARFGQKMTEKLFDSRVFGEIDEIVNVETKGEWTRRFGTRWGLWILDKPSVETRIFKGRGWANGAKDCIDFVIPMMRTESKTVESPKEEPIFIWIGAGIPRGRANNGDLIRRENSLTECVFAIPLSQRVTFFNGETDKKPKGVTAKYRCVSITFAPNPVFVIT